MNLARIIDCTGNGAEEAHQDKLLTTESEPSSWTHSSQARKPSSAAAVGDSVHCS
jgi:hypothetical protein